MKVIRRVVSIALAGSLMTGLSACKEEKVDNNEALQNSPSECVDVQEMPKESVTVVVPEIEKPEPTSTPDIVLYDEEENSLVVAPSESPEREEIFTDSGLGGKLGEPFRFRYLYDVDYKNQYFKEIGDEFTEEMYDGVKTLYDKDGKVCLSGYDELGWPFYWDLFTSQTWVEDGLYSGLSGWVIPTYTGDTFSLYAMENFETLLKDCTNTGAIHTKVDSCFGRSYYTKANYAQLAPYMPISYFYYPAYDWFHNGPGEGVLTIIEKDDVLYLVDSSDFGIIYAEGFTDVNEIYEGYKPRVEFTYADEHKEILPAYMLKSYKSDVLIREKEK